MPKLRVKDVKSWLEIPIAEKSFFIGRAHDCDHVIDSGYISRHHCKITEDPEGHHLVDLGSSLGTTVNGREVQRILLRNGDRIRLAGRWEAIFTDDAEVAFTETMDTVDPDGNQMQYRLLALGGGLPNLEIAPGKRRLRIGRHAENDLCISADTVSSFHAELLREHLGWAIADLGSGNGTFVNEVRVRHQALRSGDLSGFDRFNFRFEEVVPLAGKTGTRIRPPGPHGPAPQEAPLFAGEEALVRSETVASPKTGQSRVTSRPTIRLAWVFLLLLLILLGMGAVIYALWLAGTISLGFLPLATGPLLSCSLQFAWPPL